MFIVSRSGKLSLLLLGVMALVPALGVMKLENKYVNMRVNTSTVIEIKANNYTKCIVKFNVQHKDVLHIIPKVLKIDTRKREIYNVSLFALSAGKSEVTSNISKQSYCDLFLNVSVYKEDFIVILSTVIGWIYFMAWSVTLFPQIWSSYKRKRYLTVIFISILVNSVVGLNFDFVIFNILGHVYYSIFNTSLYCIPAIKKQYARRYPRSVIPVLLNDLVYASTVTISTSVNVVQCFIYERGNQRVSTISKILVWLCAIMTLCFLVLCKIDVLDWIDFVYFCSYVKLVVTLKYIPQMYMNYKRSSTDGWSVGYVILDMLGGFLSILQMCLNAYNYEDWHVFQENATKFGIGLLTILFDVLMMLQHYVVYNPKCEKYKQKVKETAACCVGINNATNNNV